MSSSRDDEARHDKPWCRPGRGRYSLGMLPKWPALAVPVAGLAAMVLARLLASLATTAVMGWLWLGREEWLRPAARYTGHQTGSSRWNEFRLGFQHDFLSAAVKRSVQVVLLLLSGSGLLHVSHSEVRQARHAATADRLRCSAAGAGGGGRLVPPQSERAARHFLPALSLLVYAPPALGSYTASRDCATVVTEHQRFEALPATSPLPMPLTHFTRREQQDPSQAIKGRTVQMSGLITLDEGGDGWYLTRIVISCCAADAQSVKVRIHGAPPLPADNWVSGTGTWHPGGKLGTPSAPAELDARTVEEIDRPVNGYSDSLLTGSHVYADTIVTSGSLTGR